MTSDERTLISTLFDRLNQAGAQPKDAEADDYIRAKVLEQPAAPYLLVQSTLVMQQALAAAQSRIAGLEKRLTEATRPSQESGGSFLSGVANLFGVGQPSPQPASRSVQTPPPLPPQPGSASGYAPPSIQQAAPNRGGGFLQGALSTAAGVAGGALLFQGIQNLIGHNPGPFAGLSGPSGGLISGNEPVVENTEVVNNLIEDPSTTDQSATQDPSSDATADTDPAADANSDDSFAADNGGDFLGGDDYV